MKIYEDRAYQTEAEYALLRDIEDFNPVVAIPTGAGKTKIMASFMLKYNEAHPSHDILILAHVKEILQQNYEAVKSFFPGIHIGLYSSGLKSKTIEKFTVAGIQSVYKKPKEFKQFDLIIIDECHRIPQNGSSMYMKFINAVGAKYLGLSATVFRRGVGYIYQGEKALFNKLSYDLTSMEKFNKLVSDGYLCKLISKRTDLELDSDDVKTTAGDYNQKQLALKHDRAQITKKAVEELIRMGQHNYKSWLVFAIDITHADHINDELNRLGISSRALHSKTNKFREEILDEFKTQKIKCIVSVGMVTTGFDAPNIDLICLLRPTKSAVLHIQMVGRGLRICEGKNHCLVLDFSGNTKRLGPINNVIVPQAKGKGKNTGEAPVKECPECGCLHHTITKICDVCGHEFLFVQKIKERPDWMDVVQKEYVDSKVWLPVDAVVYQVHSKVGKPDSLKVSYTCGISIINEYVCLEHGGYAQTKAENWVAHRWLCHEPAPDNVLNLYENRSILRKPKEVLIDKNAKYLNVLDAKF